jgi:TonB-dependent starch-binding outer membrane protein SusC
MVIRFNYSARWSFLVLFFLSLGFISTAQTRDVTGSIKDENSEPLVGASVVVKGTTNGVITDTDGKFTIKAEPNSTLVFSFVGFKTKEAALGSQSTLDIQLESSTLEEVVVTGYSTQKKKDLTGAVTVVETKDLLAVPATSVEQQLQGRAAGVQVINSNVPGEGGTIRIRGFGTLGNNNPLFIIDGIPTTDNLSNINQNDIESIQILKDATSASIYGSRASNGVIIITTKRGKTGDPKLTFDYYYGSQNPFNFPELLNTQQYGDYLWASKRNAGVVKKENGNPENGQYGNGKDPKIPDYVVPSGAFEGDARVNPANYSNNRFSDSKFGSSVFQITKANKVGTKWLEEIFQNAPMQNFQLGVSGATDKAKYAVSANYFNQNSILKFNSFDRFTLRANTELNIKNKVRIGENLQLAYAKRTGQYGNQSEGNEIFMAYRMQPIVPILDIQGNYAGTLGNNLGNASNPYANLERGQVNGFRDFRVFGNTYLEADLIKDLTFRSSLGLDLTFGSGSYAGFPTPENSEGGRTYSYYTNNQNRYSLIWQNTLRYAFNLGDDNKFNAYVGTEAIQQLGQFTEASRNNYFSGDPTLRFLSAGDPSTQSNNGFVFNDYRLFSYFGRLEYNIKDKYLLQGTMRYDASSRFRSAARFAAFPGVSAAWTISEEDFLKGNSLISYLKLRAGWGITGNQDIGDYNAFSTYFSNPFNNGYSFSNPNGYNFGFSRGFIGNPNAKWEKTRSINVGLDAGLMNNKLEFNLDVWDRLTTDMLIRPEYSLLYTGSAGVANANVASVSNKGIDLGLTYRDRKGDFSYNISANISTYTNEVLEIDPLNEKAAILGPSLRFAIPVTRSEKGRPLSSYYAYQIDGIFQSAAEAAAAPVYKGYSDATVFINGQAQKGVGKFRYRDVNGDNIINEKDQTFIGSPHPDFTYGLNLNLAYKGFDLTIFGQGVQGNQLFNYVKYWTDFNTFQGGRSIRILNNSWVPGKTDATLPILDENDAFSSQPSSYFIEDGSYLRIKNLQLAYTLPVKMVSKYGLSNVRFYLQGQNIATFTKYKGLDPEVAVRGNANEFGIDEGILPASRTFLVGLNLAF